MSRRWATIFLAVVLVITAASLVRVWQVSRSEPDVAEQVADLPDATEVVTEDVEPPPTRDVVLYFPSTRDDLAPEIRSIEEADVVQQQVELLMAALLKGPGGEGLRSPMPEGVQLGGAYMGSLGVVYVDFKSDLPRPPAHSSRMERLVVGSLVETVLANLPELDGVVLLWNGVQPDTFSGHLDTSVPLRGGQFPIAKTP